MVEQLIPIFCDVDDFRKGYEEFYTQSLLMNKDHIMTKAFMTMSEVMTIVICFHLSNYRTFKWYYKDYLAGTIALKILYLIKAKVNKLLSQSRLNIQNMFKTLWQSNLFTLAFSLLLNRSAVKSGSYLALTNVSFRLSLLLR